MKSQTRAIMSLVATAALASTLLLAPVAPAVAEVHGAPMAIACPAGQVAQMTITVTKAPALRGWGRTPYEAEFGRGAGGFTEYTKKGTYTINKGWQSMWVQKWTSPGTSTGVKQCVRYW